MHAVWVNFVFFHLITLFAVQLLDRIEVSLAELVNDRALSSWSSVQPFVGNHKIHINAIWGV